MIAHAQIHIDSRHTVVGNGSAAWAVTLWSCGCGYLATWAVTLLSGGYLTTWGAGITVLFSAAGHGLKARNDQRAPGVSEDHGAHVEWLRARGMQFPGGTVRRELDIGRQFTPITRVFFLLPRITRAA